MTDLHKPLGINKKHVIAVHIPPSEYASFCNTLKHKGYTTPTGSYHMPYNFLFIRHNHPFITKADNIPSNTHFDTYSHTIQHTEILRCLMPNTLKRIH